MDIILNWQVTDQAISWARRLDDYNINIVYWISGNHRDEKAKVEKLFPNTTFHPITDAMKGRFPLDSVDEFFLHHPINEHMLRKLSWCESQVFRMMDRMNPGNVSEPKLGYDKRRRLYHMILSKWLQVIDREKPDCVIFNTTPHLIADFILLCVCEYMQIQTVIVHETPLSNLYRIEDEYVAIGDTESCMQTLTSAIKNKVRLTMHDYDSAKPDYMQETPSFWEFALRKFSNSSLAELKIPSDSWLVLAEGPVESSESDLLQWYWYRIRSLFYRRRLKSQYNKMTHVPDLNEDFVYFPMHYQPERTTSPEAGAYVDQYLVVNELVHTVPSDMVIYVKEHPLMFNYSSLGETTRKSSHYDDMILKNKSMLVPVDYPQFDLIDNARVVVTATGTAGFEAVCRGTPCLTFGDAWYSFLPGVVSRDNIETLTGFFANPPAHEQISADIAAKSLIENTNNQYSNMAQCIYDQL
jgi:hypothetical protein